MKFGEDSYVICYNSHHYRLTGTDCYQMVGRSSRTRGICKGCILLEKEPHTPDEVPDVMGYIASLLEVEDVGDNIRNLSSLLAFWREGKTPVKELIADKFQDWNSWKVAAGEKENEQQNKDINAVRRLFKDNQKNLQRRGSSRNAH